MAVTTRFFTGRSSRFSSPSAREVILTLYINLAGGAHFLDNLGKGTARLVLALAGDPAEVKVFQHLLVFFDGENHGGLAALGVYDELHAFGDGLFTHGVILPRSLQPRRAIRPSQRSFRTQAKRAAKRAVSCRGLRSWVAQGQSREAAFGLAPSP